MIEKLQKISAEIFKNALKSYTMKDVLTHKKVHANNVPEMLGLFPNKGVGFKVKRKHWPEGLNYQIKRAVYKSNRNATFYGLKSQIKDGASVIVDQYPKRLQGLSKRGIWTYELGNDQTFRTDNGVTYNKNDFQAFIKIRGIGMSKNNCSQQGSKQIAQPESTQTQ